MEGTDPLNLLAPIMNSTTFVKVPTSDGIDPMKEFPSSRRIVREESDHTDNGVFPPNRLFDILKKLNFVKQPNCEGREPIRQLFDRSREVIDDNSPIERGREPIKNKPFKLNVRIEFVVVHVIRLQEHFEMIGIPPLHVHPVSPFEPIFVEVIRSHNVIFSKPKD